MFTKGCTRLHNIKNKDVCKILSIYSVNGQKDDYREEQLTHLNRMDPQKLFFSTNQRDIETQEGHWKYAYLSQNRHEINQWKTEEEENTEACLTLLIETKLSEHYCESRPN
jgi:hypothetical protein